MCSAYYAYISLVCKLEKDQSFCTAVRRESQGRDSFIDTQKKIGQSTLLSILFFDKAMHLQHCMSP